MEDSSESQVIFDSLNLNPQQFINEVFNSVDGLVDEAFNFFHQQASTLLKTDGTDRSHDLAKGVDSIKNTIQSVLVQRLSMWEEYCLQHCFIVPEGFSLHKADESLGDSSIDLDALNDPELDEQLNSLRDKLSLVDKESAELNRELQALERESVLNNSCVASVNEALQLYEQHSVHEMYRELMKGASEFRMKVEKLKTKSAEDIRHRMERKHTPNGDLFRMNPDNGLSNATLEELQEFMTAVKPT